MEGGTWGGRHIQWAGSTYWAGVNGQARWAAVREWRGWANRGCTGVQHGSVCESDIGEAKVVDGHCGAKWGRIVVTPV